MVLDRVLLCRARKIGSVPSVSALLHTRTPCEWCRLSPAGFAQFGFALRQMPCTMLVVVLCRKARAIQALSPAADMLEATSLPQPPTSFSPCRQKAEATREPPYKGDQSPSTGLGVKHLPHAIPEHRSHSPLAVVPVHLPKNTDSIARLCI